MRYKTVLVHCDLSRHASGRIELAAAICAEQGAHLIGAAMTGISREVFPKGYQAPPASLLGSYCEPLRQAAERALEHFSHLARRRGVPHETRLVSDSVPDALVLLARFADLVVVSQDDPDESLGNMPPPARMPDYVVFNAARPVLVVPTQARTAACPRRILLCWNGSREAATAMAAAVPLMQGATHVALAVFTPAFPDKSASPQELDDAQAFLKRHAVHAEIVLRDPGRDTGRAMLELAAEQEYDLVVMGCFGHARVRELLLGGATITMLRDTTLPVLMAR